MEIFSNRGASPGADRAHWEALYRVNLHHISPADPVLFLAPDRSQFVTGHALASHGDSLVRGAAGSGQRRDVDG